MKTSLTLLRRINLVKNESRFYMVLVGPSLLDEYAILRVWGRIGGQQRSMITPCTSDTEAHALWPIAWCYAASGEDTLLSYPFTG
jgi:hypothetical protein